MPLEPGSRLGPYEIRALLGAGGMGEVYRANDPRLGREVAVKVLPASVAGDAQALARFEREARAVAALSHPNIVAVYDIGRDGSVSYVVSELLDGETLRQKTSVPARRALEYARAIAEGLGAAHDRGIVHRDLKPENIFVTTDGRVKILDFGLATLAATDATPAGAMPTVAITSPGLIVGTPGYMSPEQVRGLPVDARTDIFAFGAVLFELLTGERAFRGATAADTISAILTAEPDTSSIRVRVTPAIERIVRRCLEKSPTERFQSARDLAFALDAIGLGDSDAARTRATRRGFAWSRALAGAAAVAVIGATATVAFVAGKRTAPAPARSATARFGIAASSGYIDAVSISPDGKFIVYTGAIPGGGFAGIGGNVNSAGGFWIRQTDALEPQRLSETASDTPVFFWSPDSRTLGYVEGNTLVVRDVPDAAPRRLVQLPGRVFGVAWSPAGDIVLSTGDSLYRLSAAGGALRPFLPTDAKRERWRGWPSILPGGDRFLYSALVGGDSESKLEVRAATLDGRELGTVATGAVGAAFADGHLIYGSRGALYAQPFDAAALRFTGDRVQLAPGVAQDWRSGLLAARASDNGALVYRAMAQTDYVFTWFDRSGKALGTTGAPGSYTNFDLSPDGRRIAAARHDSATNRNLLWLIDIERGVTSMVSDPNDPEDSDDPTWAPDGQQIAYRHGPRLAMRSANGGQERVLAEVEGYPDSFTRDGKFVVYGVPRGNLYEQWALDVTTPGARPIPMVTDVALSDESRFSPNGRWVAYHSNQSGNDQVYVMTFPPTGEKWQISVDGGVQPRWSPDGNELFFLAADGRLMAVGMNGSDPRRALPPRTLFATGLLVSDALDQFTATADRFLIRMPTSTGPDRAAVQVVINWRSR